jgi:excisionase family DNA binding protein
VPTPPHDPLVPPSLADHWFFKVSEVAEMCHVSEKTVRRAIKSERLKAHRPGGGIRISRVALHEWLDSREGDAE